MSIPPTSRGSLSSVAITAALLVGACAPPAFEPVWADELTGAAGAAPDLATWGPVARDVR